MLFEDRQGTRKEPLKRGESLWDFYDSCTLLGYDLGQGIHFRMSCARSCASRRIMTFGYFARASGLLIS